MVNGLTKESNLYRQLGLCCLQQAPSSLIFLTRSLIDSLCQYSSRLFHYRESQKQGNQLFQRELVFFKAKNLGQRGWGITFLLAKFITKSPKKVMYLLAHGCKQCVKITELALLNEAGREMFKRGKTWYSESSCLMGREGSEI